MYDAVVSLCERTVYQYSYTGEAPTRQGNSHPTLFPYDAFEASDGCVVIATFSDGHWNGLCEAMDRPGLAADYADPASRMEAREQLRSEIASWMSEHRVETIVGELEGRVPAAPVQDIEDIFDDSHVNARCSPASTNRGPTRKSLSPVIRSRRPRPIRGCGAVRHCSTNTARNCWECQGRTARTASGPRATTEDDNSGQRPRQQDAGVPDRDDDAKQCEHEWHDDRIGEG